MKGRNQTAEEQTVTRSLLMNALEGRYGNEKKGNAMIQLRPRIETKKLEVAETPASMCALVDAYVDYTIETQGFPLTDANRKLYKDEIVVELLRLQLKNDKGFKSYLESLPSNRNGNGSSSADQENESV